MTWLDRLLREWRMRKALRHLPAGARLLDVGTHDGLLLRKAGGSGVGLDPDLAVPAGTTGGVTLLRTAFPPPGTELEGERFDAATALAVVEHVPEGELAIWATALATLVRPRGRLVLTVPSPAVDTILHVLMRLRLVAGMHAHEHHGFVPADLHGLFTAPHWRLLRHDTFQLGLNHLFVFERLPDA